MDFGSRAPVAAFVEAFSRFGVTVTVEDARAPMGLPKRDHIREMLNDPNIMEQWANAVGHMPTDSDVDLVYKVFVPLNEEVAARHSELIPGATIVASNLRDAGVAIGSTTGYVRPIMKRVLPAAAAQGYVPHTLVCADDVPFGRPTAMMMYKCFVDLGVHEPWRVVKVDDTVPGIAEGRAAGCWTVGVSLSGNEVGLSQEELAGADPQWVSNVRRAACQKLVAAGSDYVVDTVADLMPVLLEISARIASGERPASS